jgi:hypothetical protein
MSCVCSKDGASDINPVVSKQPQRFFQSFFFKKMHANVRCASRLESVARCVGEIGERRRCRCRCRRDASVVLLRRVCRRRLVLRRRCRRRALHSLLGFARLYRLKRERAFSERDFSGIAVWATDINTCITSRQRCRATAARGRRIGCHVHNQSTRSSTSCCNSSSSTAGIRAWSAQPAANISLDHDAQ